MNRKKELLRSLWVWSDSTATLHLQASDSSLAGLGEGGGVGGFTVYYTVLWFQGWGLGLIRV